MLILTFEDSEEEILNHIISCVNTGARAFQVIENAKTNLSYGDIVILSIKKSTKKLSNQFGYDSYGTWFFVGLDRCICKLF